MKVRSTLDAAAELAAVLDCIAERSPKGAEKVLARIKATELMLAASLGIGQVGTRKPWLRRLVVQPYPCLVLYEVAGGMCDKPDPACGAEAGGVRASRGAPVPRPVRGRTRLGLTGRQAGRGSASRV